VKRLTGLLAVDKAEHRFGGCSGAHRRARGNRK
jgi:hypothetical protein